MKAIRISEKTPELVDIEPVADVPSGQVRVKVVSSSICGSDLHMIEKGFAEGRVLGHEFAGLTPDGTAVAVEPVANCGTCGPCGQGLRVMCTGATLFGVAADGAMAEEVVVPTSALVELPDGVDVANASLVEPLAVATHAVRRAAIAPGERVLVVGAGPIGLATVAVLSGMGIQATCAARHPHQQTAAESLGASLEVGDGYDVVIDAAATTGSIRDSVRSLRIRGRVVVVGTFWDPVEIDLGILMKEVDLYSSMAYGGTAPDRDFDHAARLLGENPSIASALVTHRFPLDGAAEAFATANDRSSGTIKVVFDV